MILSVKVSDEVYERYGRQNPKNPREPIERVIEKYGDIGSGKVVILTGQPLADLQKLIGQIDTPEQIVEKFKKATSVQIGGTAMSLSESQLKHIQDYSKHQGITPFEYTVREVQKALQNALGV